MAYMQKGADMVNGERPQIGFQLKFINNLIRRRMDVRFSEQGLGELSGMQGPMVGYIYDNCKKQDIFQKDIEKVFNIRRSTATVMLQNLELKGFITRQAVEHDARLKKIMVTEKAEQYSLRIREQIDEFHEELEQGITEEEKEEFSRILDKIRDNLTKI